MWRKNWVLEAVGGDADIGGGGVDLDVGHVGGELIVVDRDIIGFFDEDGEFVGGEGVACDGVVAAGIWGGAALEEPDSDFFASGNSVVNDGVGFAVFDGDAVVKRVFDVIVCDGSVAGEAQPETVAAVAGDVVVELVA